MAAIENRTSADGPEARESHGEVENGGPERVRQAVIEAAIRLFAQRGIHAVSVREIAREVGVSHTLVHLYFGSKEEILSRVLSDYDERFATQLEQATSADTAVADTFRAMAADHQFLRVLAASLIEGMVPGRLAFDSRALEVLTRRVGERTDEGAHLDARVVSTMLASVGVGWAVGGDWLSGGTGLAEEAPGETVEKLAGLLQHMVKSCI